MSTSFEQIRDQQQATWNKFSPGWKKWDEFTMRFLRPMGDEIIAALHVPPNATVLDIATGTGEPGLTIAETVPGSRVIGTDLAEGMLATAREQGGARGLANYSTKLADVSALPFPGSSFDAVSCRMGFMFFPDMSLAAREIVRVLRPGGRVATAVWSGAAQNGWITTIMAAIQRHAPVPQPPAGAPGMFRCAEPGIIAGLFREAGLTGVNEKEITGQVDYESPEMYWTMMMEVAAPVVAAMSSVDDSTRLAIQADVRNSLAHSPGTITLPYGARIISAVKA